MIVTETPYDVVVAGGGPAGLSAARAAARQGLRVLVVEKHGEIGSPTRTSGGTVIADMVALGVPPHLYHPVKGFHFYGPTVSASFASDRLYGCLLDVRGLYQFLAEQAIAAGASLRPRTQVTDVAFQGRRVRGVKLRDHAGRSTEVECSLLVDATGFPSTIAVKTGLHSGYRRAGVGAEYDLYAPAFPQDMGVLVVGQAIAPAGYAWAFPWGRHRVRAGVGIIRPDSPDDPADYLDVLLHDYAPLRESFAGASPVEFHTGVIPAEGLVERLVGDGIIAAGDAAGQSSALIGEGIRFSMYAGRLAGEVGARAVIAGDTSAAGLAPYDREWRRRFGRNLKLAYAINKRISAFQDPDWDRSLGLLKGLTTHQVAQLLATNLSLGLAAGVVARNPRALGTVLRIVTRPRR